MALRLVCVFTLWICLYLLIFTNCHVCVGLHILWVKHFQMMSMLTALWPLPLTEDWVHLLIAFVYKKKCYNCMLQHDDLYQSCFFLFSGKCSWESRDCVHSMVQECFVAGVVSDAPMIWQSPLSKWIGCWFIKQLQIMVPS